MFRRYIIGFGLLVLAEIGFGLTFVTGSALTKQCGISPEVLSFCRFIIAGTLMLVIGCISRSTRTALLLPDRRDWLELLWLAPVGTALMAWCIFVGCSRVSVANASMADALTPLMIFATAAILNRRISRGELVGLFSGFFGALLVVQIVNRHGVALDAYSLGDFFILLSAATWGIYTVCGRRLVKKIGSSAFTTLTMLVGAAMMGCILPFTHSTWPNDAKAWGLTATLAVVSTLMPFWSWNAAQKYLPVSVISVSAYFAPVVAMGLGVLLLDEHVTGLQWLGTVFIIASASIETGRQRSCESLTSCPPEHGSSDRPTVSTAS